MVAKNPRVEREQSSVLDVELELKRPGLERAYVLAAVPFHQVAHAVGFDRLAIVPGETLDHLTMEIQRLHPDFAALGVADADSILTSRTLLTRGISVDPDFSDLLALPDTS